MNGEPARRDDALVRALRRARQMLSELGGGPIGCPELARPERGPVSPHDRGLLRLAFLAPDLQRRIMGGTQPPQLNLERLMRMEIPLSWTNQREIFGAG